LNTVTYEISQAILSRFSLNKCERVSSCLSSCYSDTKVSEV
jgi:hypothetical protein